MNFLFNSISELLIGIAQEAATYCMFIFFEPEIPKSLREEEQTEKTIRKYLSLWFSI